MAGRLDGKIAIVTGAATGIGAAPTRLFVAEGAKVLAVDIKDPGESLAAVLADNSDSLRFDSLDIRRTKAWSAGLATCVRAFGHPNVLINNAGALGSEGERDPAADPLARAGHDSDLFRELRHRAEHRGAAPRRAISGWAGRGEGSRRR